MTEKAISPLRRRLIEDMAIRRYIGVSLGHRALHFDGTAHRVDDARKLDQQAVTGGLDDAAPVLIDFRIDQLPEMRPEAFVRAFLIGAHQARVTRHV